MTTFIDEQPDVVTADKCQFDLVDVAFQFKDATPKGDQIKVPFRMVARSKKPFFHWWWGNNVHDLDGMSVNEPIVVDYCHDDNRIIGATEAISIGDEGLIVEGFVLRKPNNPKHIANDVLDNAAQKVPYQASIKFAENFGLEIERVPEGTSVIVNGSTFEGPGVVFRKWHLRAVTICPHGYDHNTSSDFELSNKSVLLTYQGDAMSTATDKNKPSTQKPAGEQNPGKVDLSALTASIAELSAKVDALPQAEPPKDPMETLTETVTSLSESVAELSAKVDAIQKTDEPPKEPGSESDKVTELSAIQDSLTKLSAQVDHLTGSSAEGTRGSGGAGGDKPTFADFIKRS